jgi:hypothetical protein
MTSPNLPPGVTSQDVADMQRIIARCWIVGGLVIGLPLEQLETLVARADTEGPRYYPDIWRANAEKILQDRELMRTLVHARRELLVVSPQLEQTLLTLEREATEKRALLAGVFRDVFGRREFADVSPLVVISGLVQWIAHKVPRMVGKP